MMLKEQHCPSSVMVGMKISEQLKNLDIEKNMLTTQKMIDFFCMTSDLPSK